MQCVPRPNFQWLWRIASQKTCQPTVGRQTTNCRPTVDRQLADRFFGELFFTITGFNKLPTGYRHVTNSRPTVGRQVANISGKTCWPSVGQLSADRRPTVGWLSADSWPTVGLQVFWGALPHNYPISCNMKFPDYWKPSKLVFLKSHPGHIVKCFTINTFAVHHKYHSCLDLLVLCEQRRQKG